MDAAKKLRTEDDEDKFDAGVKVWKKVMGVSSLDFVSLFEEGKMVSEYKNGLYILRMQHREIIPINDHIPGGVKKLLKADEYSFTLNQEFERVMNECVKPRLGPDDRWIRRKMIKNLVDLHGMGFAHSVDIYRDEKLVGGTLDLQRAGSCISLSLFSHADGAGNAALAVRRGLLWKHDFHVHDVISPSNISRHFGGKLIPLSDYVRLQSVAQQKEAVLPEIADKISVAQYLKSLANG